MGPFGNKNKLKEGLHTLTEKEIQDKLYGQFRTHQPVVHDEARVLKSKEAAAALKRDEVFSKSAAPPRMEEDTRQIRERKKAEERLARISEWADEEAEAVTKASKYGWQQNSGKSFSKNQSPPAVKPASQNIVFSALKIAVVTISGILKIFSAPVFRSRNFIYFASAAAFLFVMFLGIHTLNVQRETAMKIPHKAVTPQVLAEKIKASLEKGKPAQPPAVSVSSPSAARPAVRETQVTAVSPEAAPVRPAEVQAKPAALEAPYVVQIATFASEIDAQNLVESFEGENLPAFTKDLKRAGGKIYYSVFLGRYKNYQEAQRGLGFFRKKVVAKSFQDAFIRTLS